MTSCLVVPFHQDMNSSLTSCLTLNHSELPSQRPSYPAIPAVEASLGNAIVTIANNMLSWLRTKPSTWVTACACAYLCVSVFKLPIQQKNNSSSESGAEVWQVTTMTHAAWLWRPGGCHHQWGRVWVGRAAGTVAPVNFPPCFWAGCLLGQPNIFVKIKPENVTFFLWSQISWHKHASWRMRLVDLSKEWNIHRRIEVYNIRPKTVLFSKSAQVGTRDGLGRAWMPLWGRVGRQDLSRGTHLMETYNVQVWKDEGNIKPVLSYTLSLVPHGCRAVNG